MEIYRIAICDDNADVCRFIHRIINESQIICSVDEYSNGMELLKNYRDYDILFLDIDMPQMDGIETARRIRETDRKVKIIYVTGYQDYMSRSFAVHPFSFLLKPVQKEEIISQVNEALLYSKEADKKVPLRIQTTAGVEELLPSDIYYLEYQNRKLRLVRKQGESMVRGKLLEYLERLAPCGFASPHKSFIVNLYHVKAIRGYDIVMMNGDWIPLSQKRSVEFRGLLGKYQAAHL